MVQRLSEVDQGMDGSFRPSTGVVSLSSSSSLVLPKLPMLFVDF